MPVTYSLQYKDNGSWYTVEWGLTFTEALNMREQCDKTHRYRIQPD